MTGNDKPLSERIEVPSIPKDAARQIELLEREFVRAGLDQCKDDLLFESCARVAQRKIGQN